MTRHVHHLADLELIQIDQDWPGLARVQCLPPGQRRLTALVAAGTLHPGDVVEDRGAVMQVGGRAPWAENLVASRPTDAAWLDGREAVTLGWLPLAVQARIGAES